MKLLFFLLFLSLSGKNPSANGIPYRTLSWTDFRGIVPENQSSVAARTTTELQMEITEVDGQFTYSVRAYFLPYSSFVRVKAKDVLSHEQTHFQIAYYAAIKCMFYVERLQGGDAAAKANAVTLYNKYVSEKDMLNEQFDLETNHGLNKLDEKRWEDQMQKETKLYANARRNKNP